ncbi:hypothetical protein ACTFIR_008763 [Dictyostelium discoideum]
MNLIKLFIICCLLISITVKSFEIVNDIDIDFEFDNSFDQSSSSAGSGSDSYDQDKCKGKPNPYPIFNKEPIFIASTANGKLYKTGDDSNQVSILHLYGEAYEMGYAHGTLLKEQVNELIPKFMEFAEIAIKEFIKTKFALRLPEFLIKLIEEFGVNAALDYVASATEQFTPKRFFNELLGLSDSSGIPYQTLLRMHMFPELVKATCSIVGAWSEATINGGLLQVRALDWGLENPLVNYPTLIVYHPQENDGGEFSILSWTSFIGALTGYSQRTGVCEKVWLSYNGTYTHNGMPFYFILRDILQYDNSIYEALNRIYNTPRTCAVYLGVGSNESNTASLLEVSMDVVRVFDDETPFPGFAPPVPEHPLFKDVVYVDKHSQPSTDPCMANSLSQSWSEITAQTLINTMGQMETGDLHSAVYDFKQNLVYVSVATTNIPFPFTNETLPLVSPAYKNQFIQFNMTKLFSEQPPLPSPNNSSSDSNSNNDSSSDSNSNSSNSESSSN